MTRPAYVSVNIVVQTCRNTCWADHLYADAMGFEVYVVWCEHGEPCTVAFAQLEALFAAAIRSRSTSDQGTTWTLDYEGARCEALVQGHGGTVSCVSIDRPVAAVELWETLIQAMRLGHGICFGPGNAYAI